MKFSEISERIEKNIRLRACKKSGQLANISEKNRVFSVPRAGLIQNMYFPGLTVPLKMELFL